jgi:hypothetical protein
MSQLPTTTTPDPEFVIPLKNQAGAAPAPLEGDNVRREVAGCPTGLADADQAQQAQRASGGGASGTAAQAPAHAPGEEITEEQQERAKQHG